MKNILAFILFALITALSYGQSSYQDEVYLKNARIIRGVIVEQVPNQSLKIETPDKSIFVYQIEEVEKSAKEEPVSNKSMETGRKKGFIGLDLGANIPVGKFADPSDGMAKTGFQINIINFGYLFSDNVGITATSFFASNPIKKVRNDYLWSQNGFSVGPLFSFPVSEKVEWDLKPMMGFSWARITKTNLEYVSAITYNLGTGFRFNVSRVIALTLGADYTSANFKWPVGYQSMGTIAIKGGFAFRLN